MGELYSRSRGVLVRCAQGQGQSVHTALFGGANFGGQSGVNGARPGDSVDALEGGADQQHAVVGLAAGLGAGMAGVVGAVVLDGQRCRRERLGQDLPDPIGAGLCICHGLVIGLLSAIAKVSS